MSEAKKEKTYDHKSTPKDWDNRKVVDSFTEPDGSITVVLERPKKKKKQKDSDYDILKQDMKFFKKGMEDRIQDGKPTYEKEQKEIDEYKKKHAPQRKINSDRNEDKQQDRDPNQRNQNNRGQQRDRRNNNQHHSDRGDNNSNKSDQNDNKEE